MLLADKSHLEDAVQQAFRAAGVSHLLAVSGLHLALLCGLLGFGRRWRFYKPLILLRGAAALFLSIGIYAMRRTEPMWFWIGAAVDARTLTDVRAYNHANGWMWIAYSVPFWLSAALGWKLETLGGILLGLACTVGLALVFWCYRRILKRYSKRS